jgi:CelD/BcsL family acetyltransferase involved in cellulose biosynthesis
MSDVPAYRSADIPAAARVAQAKPAMQRTAQDISVEIADAARLASLHAGWADLASRADSPNVFMDPALACAAAAADPQGGHRALLAWKSVDGRRRLVGAWAFGVGRAPRSMLPIPMLTMPRARHGHLATPAIDRDCLDETLDAMLDCIAADPALPKIAALDMMSAEGPTWDALMRVLARRGSTPFVFETSRRPKLASALDGKAYLEKSLSSSTRKKLRQHRRRLSERGKLVSMVAAEPQAVRAAFEEFLSLEAAGWKGKQGTALISDETDAAFIRGAVGALADRNCASIHSLYLDGKPVSMQLVARAGAAAFTWKTTYDETYQDFSPGALLLEDYTAAFLADKSLAFVDSCSFDDTGFMSAWSERLAIADLWIDARRGGSPAFRALARVQQGYRHLRGAAKSGYHAWRSRKPRKR